MNPHFLKGPSASSLFSHSPPTSPVRLLSSSSSSSSSEKEAEEEEEAMSKTRLLPWLRTAPTWSAFARLVRSCDPPRPVRLPPSSTLNLSSAQLEKDLARETIDVGVETLPRAVAVAASRTLSGHDSLRLVVDYFATICDDVFLTPVTPSPPITIDMRPSCAVIVTINDYEVRRRRFHVAADGDVKKDLSPRLICRTWIRETVALNVDEDVATTRTFRFECRSE